MCALEIVFLLKEVYKNTKIYIRNIYIVYSIYNIICKKEYIYVWELRSQKNNIKQTQILVFTVIHIFVSHPDSFVKEVGNKEQIKITEILLEYSIDAASNRHWLDYQ